ncbi:MAG: GNAT family N-acetyltransferase [Bacteroidia bacterium]|nr:GNAT family N-acetyltransferase [Bacteroidia bacterium]
MIRLASNIFNSHQDPMQLDVNDSVIERLLLLHPSCMQEHIDGDGPVIWVLLIPTTMELMKQFINSEISETALLDQTPLNIKYETLYLCSVMVLKEFRHQGLATNLTREAIKKIRADHPIQSLFVWPFTKEGNALAFKIAKEEKLPLFKRES